MEPEERCTGPHRVKLNSNAARCIAASNFVIFHRHSVFAWFLVDDKYPFIVMGASSK
jgi:hypothetical protein